MLIEFTPQRADAPLTLSRAGSALIINGEAFDFAALPEGAVLPRAAVDCAVLASDVTRIDGVLRLTLILPHGAHPPQEALFPQPVLLQSDGPVDLPAFDMPQPAEIEERAQ